MKPRYWRVVGPLLLVMAACGSDEGGVPSSQGSAATLYWFTSLPEIVATSDIVVLGTVVDVRDGTTKGPPGEEIQHLDAIIQVDESFYGDVAKASTLTVQTLKFVAPEQDWRAVGSKVLAFLKLSTDPADDGRYYLLTDQSVFLVTGSDVQVPVKDDPFSERVAAMTIDDIRHEIAQNIPAIDAGEISPQSPVGG